ncbi:DUF2487 family protein [Paenibacillus sp. DXFW5]|uniref:DUF2487 family protein n=1 Tax=Paenibacillus rhizolycopersici TaxID=2780073 RepID=A0ABS2H3R4_9BACL|nr:DUF2487 family protein [Paenibacillus rhizolycopersici]MBM6995478.1 DUF2487 family protein [Paenibacillus rhizolycopersici]
MKFSEIEASAWEELRPYLDTCVIPVTGLTGLERPYEVTEKLERLRDILDWVEIPFKGRVVTYPSFQYRTQDMPQAINDVCRNVKSSGFAHVLVVSAEFEWSDVELPDADLIVTLRRFSPDSREGAAGQVKVAVQELWQAKKGLGL